VTTATVPFTNLDVTTAFPEFAVGFPPLGVGQQKVAYKAMDAGVPIALKIMLQESDADDDEAELAAERFRREMKGMTSTSCPNVVSLIRGPERRLIGQGPRFWYTEPLMTHGTLRDRLRNGPLTGSEAFDLAQALLSAVKAMWTEGHFVHRDIKPENIGYMADGTIVLLDLGIALFTELSPLTESQMIGPGSSRYAAPEQFEVRRLADIDFRTDLFQVGIVLVEALTGSHPFYELGTDYMRRLTNFDQGILAGIQMPDGLREIIPRLLAAHQSGRYRKVELALEALGDDT
jgi:serine/threonine protein kinase